MTKLSGDEPAFPHDAPEPGNKIHGRVTHGGITIRLHLAAQFMQRLVDASITTGWPEQAARTALVYADALLAEYNKTKSTEFIPDGTAGGANQQRSKR